MMYVNREVNNLQLINTKTGEVLINTDFATVEEIVNHENREVTFKTAIPEIDEWISLGYTLEESIKFSELAKDNGHIQAITAEEASAYLTKVMDEYKEQNK